MIKNLFAIKRLFLGALIAALPGLASAQTATITFTTTQTSLHVYAPRNIVAVWIEKQGGGFVRTLADWAATRKQYLLAYNAVPGVNNLDAVTGATFNAQGMHVVTWDLKDSKQVKVPNGNYVVKLELADTDVTMASQNNFAAFNFTVGPQAVNTTASMGGFQNVNINYNPAAVADMGVSPPTPDMAEQVDSATAPPSAMATGCRMVPGRTSGLPWAALWLGAPLLALLRRRVRARAR